MIVNFHNQTTDQLGTKNDTATAEILIWNEIDKFAHLFKKMSSEKSELHSLLENKQRMIDQLKNKISSYDIKMKESENTFELLLQKAETKNSALVDALDKLKAQLNQTKNSVKKKIRRASFVAEGL
jgi:uncharacterized protein YukE